MTKLVEVIKLTNSEHSTPQRLKRIKRLNEGKSESQSWTALYGDDQEWEVDVHLEPFLKQPLETQSSV